VLVTSEAQTVIITGTNTIVPEAKKRIAEFFQNSTIFKQVVWYPTNQQKFVVTFWMTSVDLISKQLKQQRVKIVLKDERRVFELQGTSEGLDKARKMLEELGTKIGVKKERYTSPTMLRFLKDPEYADDLERLGSKHKCVLSLQEDSSNGLQTKVLYLKFKKKKNKTVERLIFFLLFITVLFGTVCTCMVVCIEYFANIFQYCNHLFDFFPF
jgi:hypothetical protein